MTRGMSLRAIGHATSLSLAITFVLCVGFDLVFPSFAMHQAWQSLSPGFTWITWSGFLIGAVDSYGYGWYIALLWVPLCRFLAVRASNSRSARPAA